jgi:hypothetical protein
MMIGYSSLPAMSLYLVDERDQPPNIYGFDWALERDGQNA